MSRAAICTSIQATDSDVTAILVTIVAGFVSAAMDAPAKWLMQSLPTQPVVWARYFLHTAIVGSVFTLQTGAGMIVWAHERLLAVRTRQRLRDKGASE